MEVGDRADRQHADINPLLRQGFMLNDVAVLPKAGMAVCQGQRNHLAPKALEILLYLCENSNQLINSEELLDVGWGDVKTKRSNLSHVISEIRHALDDHKESPEFIQTIPKRGYRLIANVAPLDDKVLYPNVWPKQNLGIAKTNTEVDSDSRLSSYLALIKSSTLVSVSIAFIVTTWILIQIFEVMFPIFGIPDWGLKIAVLVLVTGFPLALVFTWLKEVKKGKYLVANGDDEHKKKYFFIKLAANFCLIGALSIGVGYLALYLIESIEIEKNGSLAEYVVDNISIPVQDNLIAVLPFRFQTGAMLPEYFTATFQGELISVLTKQEDFNLVSQRAVNEVPADSGLSDYTNRLGARYLLDGTIAGEQQHFTIVLSLTDTQNSLQVWSSTIRGTPEKILNTQKELYRQVFNALALLGKHKPSDSQKFISTNDFKAYDSYIQGKSQLTNATSESQLQLAERHFLTALKFDPRFSLASAGLCQTYLDQYQMSNQVSAFKSAKQWCGSLLGIEQLKGEAYVALGNLNRISGEHSQAMDFYQKALALNPQNLHAITGTALSNQELGNLVEAEKLLQKAIRLEPGYWSNYLNLGDFLFANGKYRAAREQYARVTLLKPDYEQGFNRLGASFYLDDQLEQASIAWQRSLAIQPSANNYSNVGTALFFSHQFKAAGENYRKAIQLKPADPVLWANLGDSEKFSERPESSQKSYKKALDLAQEELLVNPHNQVAQAMRARYQSELGNCAAASKTANALAAKNTSDPYLFYDLSIIAVNCNETPEAKRLIDKAVTLGYSQKLLARDIQFASIFGKTHHNNEDGDNE